MQANVACVQRAGMNDARGAAHKSRTHRLLGPHKQAEGWNVLALSNSRWKLPSYRTEVRRRCNLVMFLGEL